MIKKINFKTITNLFIGTISIFVGGFFYVVYRPNSYIHQTLKTFLPIDFSANSPTGYLLSCYLPDFLWALSLCCFINVILHTKKVSFLPPLITLCMGLIWETLQGLNLISGTGDIFDILLYLAAGIIAVIINLFNGKRMEKI